MARRKYTINFVAFAEENIAEENINPFIDLS
jgi:hypothetical protein